MSTASVHPQNNSNLPVGGAIQHHLSAWQRITSKPWILHTVENGLHLEMDSNPPLTKKPPKPTYNPADEKCIDELVQELLYKKALRPVKGKLTPGFYHQLFTVIKRDSPGKRRPVINARPLNRYIRYKHFKMEGLGTLQDLIMPGDWMVKIDLQDAYLHVPIELSQRKFLRFVWKGRVYEFQVLPFGISSAPRAFTKLMREPIAVLRAEGLRLVIYIDDILILGRSIEEIKSHADKALSLLQELGFRIKWEKCQLEPTQRVKFLGFIVDSVKMTLSLPHDKIHKIRKESRQLLKISTTTLRKLASFLGLLASVAPAVSSARLHQNQLLRWKNQLMKVHKGNWDAFISIPSDLQEELLWWRDELHRWNGKSIIQQKPEITIITDASEKGYGGHREDNPQIFVQGAWTTNERQRHNNWRELKVRELVLKKMLKSVKNTTVSWVTDNTTAAAYVRRMGGKYPDLSSISVQLLNWCFKRNIILQPQYRPGTSITTADALSRRDLDRHDWRLNRRVFQMLQEKWGPLHRDLFATRESAQLPRFLSLLPEAESEGTDAFLHKWKKGDYALPPFALIGRTIRKALTDRAEIVLITPLWRSAHWFPLLEAVAKESILLPLHPSTFLAAPNGSNPWKGKPWQAIAWYLSDNNCQRRI